MDHGAHAAPHAAFLCSGLVWSGTGGSYVGHILPGVFLLAWALHWFISSTYASLISSTYGSLARRECSSSSSSAAALAHHDMWLLPRCLGQNVEPLLKVIFPAVAIILEFKLSGTRYLRCPAGTAKAGELDVRHMNSWSHGTNYPPIMLSGLVDLLHTHVVPLPPGMPHFFLSAAFGSSAFLMLAHAKAEALDALVHQLLGYCMAAVAAAVLAQGAVTAATGRRSYSLDAAKSLALVMEACWFFAISHILFSGDPTWSASLRHDMSRVMFTPVLFAWIFIGALCFLLMLYVAMHLLLVGHSRSSRHTAAATGARGCCGNSIKAALGSAGRGGCGVCEYKGLKPWICEEEVGQLQRQQQQHVYGKHGAVRVYDNASDAGSRLGESSSDTSIEMV